MIKVISYYVVAITFQDGDESTFYLEADTDLDTHFDKKLIKFREHMHSREGDFIYIDRDSIARVDLETIYRD